MGKRNNEIDNEVYRFIKLIIIVVILVFAVYTFTNKFVTKEFDIRKDGQQGEISTHNIIVGSLFNRPYQEYYVLAYKGKDNNASLFETYLYLYESKEDSLRIFAIDLDDSFNVAFYSEIGNNEATTLDDLKISSPTLIKIKDKKIVKYIEGKDKIKQELNI